MASATALLAQANRCADRARECPAHADRLSRDAAELRAEAGLVTAPADKVSPRQFLDAVTGRSDAIRAAEREQMITACIRAVQAGNTYGWPPLMVAEARERMSGSAAL